MLSPFFTSDKTCDDELVIEDYWVVPFAIYIKEERGERRRR